MQSLDWIPSPESEGTPHTWKCVHSSPTNSYMLTHKAMLLSPPSSSEHPSRPHIESWETWEPKCWPQCQPSSHHLRGLFWGGQLYPGQWPDASYEAWLGRSPDLRHPTKDSWLSPHLWTHRTAATLVHQNCPLPTPLRLLLNAPSLPPHFMLGWWPNMLRLTTTSLITQWATSLAIQHIQHIWPWDICGQHSSK